MKDKRSLVGIFAVGGFLGIIVAVLVMVLSRPIRPAAIEIQVPEPTAPLATAGPTMTAAPEVLHVFVSGAVAVSDVYDLPPGSLVKDAIVMAGGFTADANQVVLNQALAVRDGDHIHVPTMAETGETPPVISGEAEAPVRAPEVGSGIVGGLVNINTASQAELEDLPGIGPALAQSIIEYREAIGPFETIEDIMKVSGIGTAKFEGMKELITVGN
jgi:competence protein ComEA